MLDLKHELFVAEEAWDFLGGGTFDDLLNIFEKLGIELRPERELTWLSFSAGTQHSHNRRG